MSRLIVILVVLSLATGAVQASEWTDFQKTLGASYISLVATDLVQSQHWIEHTKKDPRKVDNGLVWEANPLVAGRSIGETTVLAIGANYILYRLVDNMKPTHRTIVLLAANLIEGSVVYNNHKTMKRFGFSYQISF